MNARMNAEIGVFGGSGFYSFLDEVEEVEILTPYGKPSAPFVVGSRGPRNLGLPRDVRIVNNTILTGARRSDGYLGSLRMSSRYGGLPRRFRPLLANNVIGFLERRWPVCKSVRASVSNVVVDGVPCSSSDVSGPADLDARGRPTADSSLLIDAANRRYAPRTDITGRHRGPSPDIGAYEYRG